MFSLPSPEESPPAEAASPMRLLYDSEVLTVPPISGLEPAELFATIVLTRITSVQYIPPPKPAWLNAIVEFAKIPLP
ncbi:MAG: hypothetical protein GIKADHBN_02972 [Phycisphaerales bacterium]|nr:hypothetical protein [Phycisphaerales bacterium]